MHDRLHGLTDEYFWEPVPGCWSVRPRGTGTAPLTVGSGPMLIGFAMPTRQPPPFTTIAWRLGHVIVGVLAMRNAAHSAARPPTTRHSNTAPRRPRRCPSWTASTPPGWPESLGEAGLARPCGPAEGLFAETPLAALVLHINREVIHHLAEVCLLRDLYQHTRREVSGQP